MMLCLTPSNWRRRVIIFSTSLPVVLRRTIGRNDLALLYESLPGLGMITEVDCLKCLGQYPTLIQALAIQVISWLVHGPALINRLIRRHVTWSGPGAVFFAQPCRASKNSC